jgi:phage-related protein
MARQPITFHGDSLDCLRDFPDGARTEMGHQLYQVEMGLEPADWKPMPTIGPGVREIRVRDATGAYRAVYIKAYAGSVHVLHCFKKKSQKTARRDLEIARTRLREVK